MSSIEEMQSASYKCISEIQRTLDNMNLDSEDYYKIDDFINGNVDFQSIRESVSKIKNMNKKFHPMYLGPVMDKILIEGEVEQYAHKRENIDDAVIYGREAKMIYKYFAELQILAEITISIDKVSIKMYKADNEIYSKNKIKTMDKFNGKVMKLTEVPKKVISEVIYAVDKVISC